MHLELILNAVNINFVTFSDFFDSLQLKGNIFSIFVIARLHLVKYHIILIFARMCVYQL